MLTVVLMASAPVSATAPASPTSGESATDAWAAVAAQGDQIDLFYGTALNAEAWSIRDRASFTAALPSLTLSEAYNQWLAIADLRQAYYEAGGALEPGGVTVYPSGDSAVIHALDLALWSRENALLWLLGLQKQRPYPPFGYLGYHVPWNDVQSAPAGNAITPDTVGALVDQLPLSPALFSGDRVFIMPNDLSGAYAYTDVAGPGIHTWLGANATIDLRHVLYHELGHAVHFRFGGYDTVSTGQPLSPFWQAYLQIRGLTWEDPTQVPTADSTMECFAEDFAYLFRAPGDVLGYQAACGAPTAAQQASLLAFLESLPEAGYASVYQQAQWLQWQSPWPSLLFGGFQARVFTARSHADVSVALSPEALGGPYSLTQVSSGDVVTSLATLQPGQAWSQELTIPADGVLQVNGNAVQTTGGDLTLSSLDVYRNRAFIPQPSISGVFPDTLGSWAESAIAAAVRLGIVDGYPNGLFVPQGDVTRAELARMLATALPGHGYLHAPASSGFSDVASTFWAEPYVATVGHDLPGTKTGGPFDPNQPTTREEAVAWIAKALAFSPLSPGAATDLLDTYPGGTKVAAVDAPWFAGALAAGIISGQSSGGDLDPLAPVTRAEAVVLVMRALEISEAQAAAG